MLKVSFFAFMAVLFFSFSGCVRYKSVVYMNDRFSVRDSAGAIITSSDKQVILHPGDNLYINVFGPNIGDLGLFSKLPEGASQQTGSYLQGYVIDPLGEVNFPVTGKVKLAGLSLEQAQKIIQEKVNEYIVNAVVDVRLLNYTITVLGEVNRPGPYIFSDLNVNLLDALGKAGDCSPYGDKKQIMIVRKDGDKTITSTVNILKSDFMANPYFWLKPNDVVYIKPVKAKMLMINAPLINIVLTTVTTISTVLIYTTYISQ